METTIPLLLAT